jgi:hypothetical protein
MGAAVMKKDLSYTEDKSDISMIPPLREITLNVPSMSSVNPAQQQFIHKRENSLSNHVNTKVSDASKSPIREISIKAALKTRYNAVTPKNNR